MIGSPAILPSSRLLVPRRQVLRGAAAALLAGPAILEYPRHANGYTLGPGGQKIGISCYTGPAQPTLASNAGFNCLSLWDDFTTISTIDVNNTGAPGYLWYVQNLAQSPNIPPASSFSVTSSVLTCAGTLGQGNPVIKTFGGTAGGTPKLKGINNFLRPGGYFEVKMRYATVKPSANFGWPEYWMADINNLFCQPSQAGYAGYPTVPGGEIDFYEAFANAIGDTVSPIMTIHDWANGSSQTANTNNHISVSLDSSFHTYGTLWQTQAQNGGSNGLIQRYFDGTHLSNDVTYSSGGTSPQGNGTTGQFSILDRSEFIAFVGTAAGWQADFDYVMAWQ